MYSINKKLLKEKNKNSFSEDDKRRILSSFKHLNDDDKILVLLSQIIGNRFKATKKIVHETFFELREKFPRHFKNFYFASKMIFRLILNWKINIKSHLPSFRKNNSASRFYI